MISLQQMRYLVVLSEELQFSRASERCFVTQPTLSMQVKKAEEILGYAVFDRANTPLSLTPYGAQVIPVLREILNENDKLKAINDRMSGLVKEEIRIGIIPTVSVYLLPAMFRSIAGLIPEARVVYLEHRTEELLSALDKGLVDLAILAGPYQQIKFRTIPLFKEEIEVYTKLGSDDVINIKQLEGQQPWLLSKGNCLRTQVVNFCNIKESQDAPWDYIGGNMEILVDMVNTNGGYTLLPAWFHTSNERSGYRKKLESTYGRPAREIIGVFANRSYKAAALERIIKEIQLSFNQTQNAFLHVLDWR